MPDLHELILAAVEARENLAKANDPHTILRHCVRDRKVLERHTLEMLQSERGICFWCSEDGYNPIIVDYPCVEIRELAEAYEVDMRNWPKTEVTEDGLKKYDDLPAREAIYRAWHDKGLSPTWHTMTRRALADMMPLLNRALNRYSLVDTDEVTKLKAELEEAKELIKKVRWSRIYHYGFRNGESVGICRTCGGVENDHRMHCRHYVGPLVHAWVYSRPNGTFGGVDHDCSCGRSVRVGGMAGTEERVCPDVHLVQRGRA